MMHFHELSADRLPLRASLQVVGTHCALSSNSNAVVDAMRQWIRPHPSSPTLTINIAVDPVLQPGPGPAAFRGINHVVFASFGSDFFGLDLRRRRVSGVVSRETALNQSFWNKVLLPIVMGVMGCVVGVVPMHCACLEWRGDGLLVAGVSGAGKSTLSAAMAQYGFSFISDDWTYVSDQGDALAAHGLGIPIKLLPDSQRFFDALKHHRLGPSMNGEWAFEVDPDDFSARKKMMTQPKRLLLLERNQNGPVQFKRVGPEIAREFFERSSERLPGEMDDVREFRSRIIDRVAQLECWHFCYSGSPHDAANSIRYFLER